MHIEDIVKAFVIYVAPFVIWTMTMLAQVPVLEPGLVQLIGNGLTIVVLAWYVVYDVRTRTPAMITAFKEEQAEARKMATAQLMAFAIEQNAQRAAAEAALDKVRALFMQEQAQMREAFSREHSKIHEHYREELADYRAMVSDLMGKFRDAVHDVRGVGQQVVGAADLAVKEVSKKL